MALLRDRAAERCENETGCGLSIPWDVSKCMLFGTWATKRNLTASTIMQYFSRIKALHRKWGLSTEACLWAS